jgi:hypothetical protein
MQVIQEHKQAGGGAFGGARLVERIDRTVQQQQQQQD